MIIASCQGFAVFHPVAHSLDPILKTVQQTSHELGSKPLLLKIAPPPGESEIADILQLIFEHHLSGIVATNTPLDHSSITLKESGGFDGIQIRKHNTDIMRFIHPESSGQLRINGAGGVFTRSDYLEKPGAGASLVQGYTCFVYQGTLSPGKFLEIGECQGLFCTFHKLTTPASFTKQSCFP